MNLDFLMNNKNTEESLIYCNVKVFDKNMLNEGALKKITCVDHQDGNYRKMRGLKIVRILNNCLYKTLTI